MTKPGAAGADEQRAAICLDTSFINLALGVGRNLDFLGPLFLGGGGNWRIESRTYTENRIFHQPKNDLLKISSFIMPAAWVFPVSIFWRLTAAGLKSMGSIL